MTAQISVNATSKTVEELRIMTIRKGITPTDAVQRAFAIATLVDDLIPEGGQMVIIDPGGNSHVLTIT